MDIFSRKIRKTSVSAHFGQIVAVYSFVWCAWSMQVLKITVYSQVLCLCRFYPTHQSSVWLILEQGLSVPRSTTWRQNRVFLISDAISQLLPVHYDTINHLLSFTMTQSVRWLLPHLVRFLFFPQPVFVNSSRRKTGSWVFFLVQQQEHVKCWGDRTDQRTSFFLFRSSSTFVANLLQSHIEGTYVYPKFYYFQTPDACII